MTTKEGVLLKGIVEADETYIGGKPKKRKGSDSIKKKKTVVLGAVERGGDVVARVIPKINQLEAIQMAHDHFDTDTILVTDEHQAYIKVAEYIKRHEKINHSAYEYVRGIAHTNTIEGFWILVKKAKY